MVLAVFGFVVAVIVDAALFGAFSRIPPLVLWHRTREYVSTYVCSMYLLMLNGFWSIFTAENAYAYGGLLEMTILHRYSFNPVRISV